MSSSIPSIATPRGQIIELIQNYGTNQQRRFEVLRTNPLNCENLLDLLITTTHQPEKDPEHLSLLTQYLTQLMSDIGTELNSHGHINIETLLPDIRIMQQSTLTLPQQAQGTQTILSYLQTKAQDLIPQIMNQIHTTRQEDPSLLLSYQRSLQELLPYLFTNEYHPEILKEVNEYIAYLTSNPNAGSVEVPDDLSAAINDIGSFQAKYMDLQESNGRFLPMLKELQTLAVQLNELANSLSDNDPEPPELQLLEEKTLEMETLGQHIKELSDNLISLPEMLTNSKDLLITKDALLLQGSSHEDILKGLQAQAKILNFLFVVYNTDVCIKKILIQNKPQQLEQTLGLITSTPHAPLSDHVKEQIQEMFDSSRQEIIETNTILGIQPTTQEIKESELTEAIDGWLTDLDGIILSIETEEFALESLNDLIQDFHSIISRSTPLEEVDAAQARFIVSHLAHYTTLLNHEALDWSAETWVSFLTNEIKSPLEKLIRPQVANDLDDVLARLDQLAANIKSS